MKRGLQNFHKPDLILALDYESYALDICRNTEDFREGFQSFPEKREAVFKGK